LFQLREAARLNRAVVHSGRVERGDVGHLTRIKTAGCLLARTIEITIVVALALLNAKYGRELPFLVAEAHAWRGENDLAFAWLDRAYAARDSYVCDIKLSSAFQRLAGDPRYKAFLRKMKLPE
jgi:hypothetical protein